MITFHCGFNKEQVEKLQNNEKIIFPKIPVDNIYVPRKNTFDYIPRYMYEDDSIKAREIKEYISNDFIEDWNKIFSNARRGWDIGERKNVKPNLKTILTEWDSFASDDYFLAPDREAVAELEKQKKLEEEKKRAEQAEEARLQDEKRKQDYNAICNKQSALNYLLKYCPIKRQEFLVRNSTFKELSEKYHFSVMDAINYFEHKEDCNE